MVRFRDVLQNRNFRLLWIGQMVSQCGDRLTQLALVAVVAGLHPGSAKELAGLLMCTIAPTFLIGPFAGVFVDRWDRRRTMIACDVLRAVLILMVIWCVSLPHGMVYMYVSVFLVFSATRFFLPAKLALLPEVVPDQHLLMANSIMSASGLIAAGISFGIGGWLILRTGVEGGLVLDAATYVLSAAALWGISTRTRRPMGAWDRRAAGKFVVSSVVDEFVEGLRLSLGVRSIRSIVVVGCCLWSVVGVLGVVGTIWIQQMLGRNPAHLGFLVTLLLAGVLTGALAMGRLGGRWRTESAVMSSLLGAGALIVLFSVVFPMLPVLQIVAGMMILLGLTAAPSVVSVPTWINERLSQDVQGRVFGSLVVLADAAMAVSLWIGSSLADMMGAQVTLCLCGAVLMMCSWWILRGEDRTIDSLTSLDPARMMNSRFTEGG